MNNERRKILAGSALFLYFSNLQASTKRTIARASEVCSSIKYPWQYAWMSMRDIDEIGKGDALLLAREVYRAHNTFASQEVINLVKRLEKFKKRPHGTLLDLSLKRATHVFEQTRNQKLSDQWVTAAICLEIGRHWGSSNVAALSASIIRPYLDDNVANTLKNYTAFKRNPRKFKKRPWYNDAKTFRTWIREAERLGAGFMPLKSFESAIDNAMSASLLYNRIPNEKVIPESKSKVAFSEVFKAKVD